MSFVSDDDYYWSPVWEDRLESLLTFCDSSQSLLLLTGGLGSGKTVLLNRLLAKLREDTLNECLDVHYIEANAHLGLSRLAKLLFTNFNVSLQSLGASPEQHLLDWFRVFQQTASRSAVLVIDEAHLLSESVLAGLLKIVSSQKKRVCLRVILSGEPSLEQRVEEPFTHVSLGPLSVTETNSYLNHYLERSGKGMQSSASIRKAVTHIHELSGGLPGRMNRVTQQVLADLAQSVPVVGVRKSSFLRNHQIKFLSVLLLALMAALGWFLQSKPATVGRVEIIPARQSPLYNKTAFVPAPAPRRVFIPALTFEKNVIVSKGDYTLQLMGVYHPERLRRQLARLGKLAVLRRTVLNKKPWYILVYGHYHTVAEARAAVRRLPWEWQERHPWVRALSSI